MAGKRLQISLEFNANTTQAKNQMKELQTQLSNLVSSSATGQLGIIPQLQEAQTSAMNLKIALNNAMNVNTGKLNLNKFQSELNRSGKTLQQYAQSMRALGPEGVRTFSQIAQAVAQADTKLFSLQGGMKKLATTFMNTVRWQVTAAAIQGVTSAISDTVNYAKELDTSLNNIRIVTGKSAEQMARFAKEANNMAKQLSTTTTKYSDASLIYYQQGLNDKEVKERTDTTVKLANVVGAQAQEVSEWMTAIWNNFDDGSEALEYYADVLAKLGAATASSADEIAGGLEKFAAVADTIGLSYEYAASMLATITAETRQSEDVVGTALKTILSRMEQLKQGDTLDDGTSLGQYSLALQKIGVNIKDASGELKDMDLILQQTGQRWDTLARDQQIALAQSVAGIRQYTQFMALMDNWDVMENNLKLTEEANGALSEQHEIYEDSMAAAENRMKATAEEVKNTLLSANDLKPLYNFAGGALEVVNELLEAFGGLPTILWAVAAALTKVYQPQVASFFSQTALGLKNVWAQAKNLPATLMGKEVSTPMQDFKTDFVNKAAEVAAADLPEGSAQSSFLKKNAAMQTEFLKQQQAMSPAIKQEISWRMELIQAKQQEIIANEALLDQATEMINKSTDKAQMAGVREATTDAMLSVGETIGRGKTASSTMIAAAKEANTSHLTGESRVQALGIMQKSFESLKKSANDLDIATDSIDFIDAQKQLELFAKNGEHNLDILIEKITNIQNALQNKGTSILGDLKTQGLQEAGLPGTEETDILDKAVNNKRLTAIGLGDSLNKIDDKQLSKQNKTQLNSLKKQAQSLKSYKKELSDLNKVQNKDQKTKERIAKIENKLRTGTEKLRSGIKKLSTDMKAQSEEGQKVSQTLNNVEESAISSGAAIEANQGVIEGVNQEADALIEGMADGGASFEHWSDKLALGVSGLTSYLMGLNMLTSAFEQLGKAVITGGDGWSDWISNLSSVFMSIMMIIPGIQDMQKSIVNTTASIYGSIAAKKVEKRQSEQTIITNKREEQSEQGVQQEKQRTSLFSIIKAWAGVAEDAGKGMPGWVEAAASAAMIAPIAVMVGGAVISGISGASQAKQEKQQEEVDKGVEQLEGISENQELATSVNDLTKEYERLQAAGEGTKEVFEDLKEQIPDLISSYKELETSLGKDFDISGLERAYEYFLATGDASKMIAEQARIDTKVNETKQELGQNTARSKANLMLTSATKGSNDGRISNGKYKVTIGGTPTQTGITDRTGTWYSNEEVAASKILEDEMGEMWNGQQISFDATSSGSVVEGYEKMIAARTAMEKAFTEEQLSHMDTYRELNREIGEMSEHYEQLQEIQTEVYEAAQQSFPDEERDLFADYNISSLENYKTQRKDLIDILQKEYDLTTAQAEALLKESEIYGRFEDTYQTFGEDSTIVDQIKQSATLNLKEVQDWYMSLPEQDRTLFIGLDFSTIDNLDEAKAKMEELREQALIAEARTEAEKFEVDNDTFDTYAYLLASTNKELEENSSETAKVALANIRLNKGLETLRKSWNDNFNALAGNERGSLEYAQALGEVKSQLEDIFDIELSPIVVENNLQLINELANGNVEVLDDLQDKMAEDYVANMVINDFSMNENEIQMSAEEARQMLQNMLNDIDNSVEIGKEVTISNDYLNTLQDMVDAGQVTEEQLTTMFKAKGFDFKVTGWREVDGPKKIITRTHKLWNAIPVTDVIEEQEKMQVPIINGNDKGIVAGTASKATITKLTDKTSFDYSNRSADQGGELDSKKDEFKKLDEEIERYHEIEKTISSLERTFDRLSKAKDRAFGAEKIALIDAMTAATEKNIEAQKKLIEEAKTNLINDGSIMKTYGAQFDEYGNITNYTELMEKWVNDYNEVVKKGTESQKEQAEELYEDFTDDLQQYEETLEKVNTEQDKLNDQLNELVDLSLEKIEYTLELKLDLADKDKEIIEFLIARAENTMDTAMAIQQYQNAYTIANSQFAANETAIKDLLSSKGLTEEAIQNFLSSGDTDAFSNINFTEEEMNSLNEWSSALFENYEEARAAWEGMHEALMSGWEDYNEDMDNAIDKMSFFSDLIDNYTNLIDLAGRDILGVDDDFLNMLKKTQQEIRLGQLENENKALDAARKAYAALEAAKNAATDEEQIRKYEEEMQVVWESIENRTNNIKDILVEGIEAAAEILDDRLKEIADDFISTVTGYKNTEELQSAFDRQAEMNERYLEDYEKMYELTKLTRQVAENITSSDNPTAKEKLLKIQEKIVEYQANGVKMTSYELSNLQKEYELELALIALEDAKNAKNTVRLTRDSQGNYGYVYTANETNVNQAQNKVDEALYFLVDNTQQYIQETDEALVQAQIDLAEKIADMQSMTFKTEEERLAYFNKINSEFLDDVQFLTNQMDKALLNNQKLYNDFTSIAIGITDGLMGTTQGQYSAFAKWFGTTYKTDVSQQTSDFINGFNETFIGNNSTGLSGNIITAQDLFTQLQGYIGSPETTGSIFGNINTAYQDFATATDVYFGAAGMSVDKFSKDVNSAVNGGTLSNGTETNGIKATISALEQEIDEDTANMNKDFANNANAIRKWESENTNELTEMRTSAYLTNTAIRTLWGGYSGLAGEKPINKNVNISINDGSLGNLIAKYQQMQSFKDISKTVTITTKYQSEGAQGTSADNEYTLPLDNLITMPKQALYTSQAQVPKYEHPYDAYGAYGKGQYGAIKLIKDDQWVKLAEQSSQAGLMYKLFSKKTGETFWTKANLVTAPMGPGFDTGGYTGEWGPEGRLAMLHQKEIVLNAHDTENFLSAIQIVRSIADKLDANARLTAQGLGNISAASRVGGTGDTLQQEVTIHAEFPNATDRNEIQEAFGMLLNEATQYVNRK